MSARDSTEWTLIDRYLAGECSVEEVRAVEARRATDPAFGDAIAAAKVIRDAAGNQAPAWDLDGVWRGVVRRTAAAQDPVKVRMPGLPTRQRFSIPEWCRLAAAALVVAVGAATWRVGTHWLPTHSPGSGVATRVYTTAPGERLTVTLSDGTQLTLAPDTRLGVPATYGVTSREVTLEGEAVFTATHDVERPFTVRTSQAVTRDIGTTFDIQAYPEATTTRVIVSEGRVDVRGVSVGAGQLALVARHGVPTVTSGVHADRYLAWRTGQLVFEATPVPEVLATISRWYDLDVRAPDPALATRHVTATFTNAPVDEVLTSLAATLAARVDRSGRTVTLSPIIPADSPP
jgi:transmembrane sensor